MLVSFLAPVALLAGLVNADTLITSRHQKRFVDPSGNYNITILHTNDIHAHLDEWRTGAGTDCVPDKECIAGYARIKAKVDEVRPGTKDALLLNIGDEFQGTLFYGYYGGEKIADTVNRLGYDAFTLGNHEFDGGDDKLAAFLKNLTMPVVCANLVPSSNSLKSLDIKPYHIFEQHSLAVIGILTPDTLGTSSAGPGTQILDPIPTVQKYVDELKAKNISRIIAMTHIGYDKDIELARATRGVDLIVGGHSHTPLGNFQIAQGPYPTIAKNLDGEEVFIVTAYRWGEYLGYIDIAFDQSGKIVKYEGQPIRLTNTTTPDAKLKADVAEWRKPFDAFAKEVVGQATADLDQSVCQKGECTLGNLITDAMLAYRKNSSSSIDGAMINAGGIRATIPAGPVTRGGILTSFPFLNAVVDLTWSGQQLWSIFEGIVSTYSTESKHAVTSFVQISGTMAFTYNPSNANGTRLISLSVGGKPVDLAKNYTISTVDFVATGGDFFFAPRKDFVALDTLDVVLTNYITSHSPVTPKLDGRIATTTATSKSSAAAMNRGTSWMTLIFVTITCITFL